MIGMLVGDQNSVQLLREDAQALHPQFDLAGGKTTVDHQEGAGGGNQGRIALAATAERSESH